jgi:two-component system chemotaxis sensor kinase CheA
MDISMDRSILENLSGPLVHMIRNAVDHGIEPPDERRALGKPVEGSISIKAYARRDRVVIEVSDDGGGIDIERLKVKAASRGISLERLRSMSRKDILMLICMPGFSTADSVTETSGRGVGMDVVKSSIEGLGGTLDLDTVPGSSTTIRMELPRTTSIIKALLVTVGDELFLVPISKVEKVVEVDAGAAPRGVMDYNDMEVPLIPIGRVLGVSGTTERATCTVVLVEDPGPGVIDPVSGLERKRFVGLKVDDFGEEIDAYIKPLLPPMSRVRGVSGITITGDGRPVFLVDVPGIIAMAGQAGAGDRGA